MMLRSTLLSQSILCLNSTKVSEGSVPLHHPGAHLLTCTETCHVKGANTSLELTIT